MDLGVYELEFSGFNEVVEEVVNEDVFILKVKTMKVGDATSALLRPTPSGLEDLLYRKEYPMYHEVIESGMRCKIYVDVDCKLSKSAMKKYEYLFEKGRFYHNIRDIATSIISDVNIHLSSILPDIKAVWFVSSASDRVGGVISLHFTCNYGFEDISCVGHFINEVVFRKYDDMIDKGCYKKLQSMRTVLSYTDEKTRPLEPILNPNGLLKLSNYFITNLPKRRILPYKMPENHPKRAGNGTNSGVGKVNLDEIQEYLDLYPEKYYTDRNEWIKIGFSLGNLDKSDAMMDIFIKFSMKWKNFMVDERKHRRDAENLIEDATEDRKGGSYLWSARLKELEEMFPEKCKEIYSKYHLMPEKELNVIKLLPGSEYTFKMFRDQYSGKVIRDLKEPLGDMKKCIGIATNESESLVITIYENKIIVEDINKFTRNNKMYKVQLLCDKGRVREVSFPDLLSKNSPHLAYNNVVFSPGGLKNPKDFNLFTGFSGRLLGDSEYNAERKCRPSGSLIG
jgi:hypothetical protein